VKYEKKPVLRLRISDCGPRSQPGMTTLRIGDGPAARHRLGPPGPVEQTNPIWPAVPDGMELGGRVANAPNKPNLPGRPLRPAASGLRRPVVRTKPIARSGAPRRCPARGAVGAGPPCQTKPIRRQRGRRGSHLYKQTQLARATRAKRTQFPDCAGWALPVDPNHGRDAHATICRSGDRRSREGKPCETKPNLGALGYLEDGVEGLVQTNPIPAAGTILPNKPNFRPSNRKGKCSVGKELWLKGHPIGLGKTKPIPPAGTRPDHRQGRRSCHPSQRVSAPNKANSWRRRASAPHPR
jgi:hypothetical protein